MYQHETISVLGLAEYQLDRADATEVSSAVELQQRDQIFLALFSIFMKINDANYQGKYKNGYFPHGIGFPRILEILFPSAFFFFFHLGSWSDSLRPSVLFLYNPWRMCVCVFTSVFLKEGNRSGVYDTKLVLLDRNEIFSSDVFYLDIYLSSKLKKF